MRKIWARMLGSIECKQPHLVCTLLSIELLFAYEKLSTSVCDESPKMFFLTFKEHATHVRAIF